MAANARDLRLQADYDHVLALIRQSDGAIRIESTRGKPPDQYVLTYECRGIERIDNNRPVYRHTHRVRIKLPARYPAPAAAPIVEMLTPIFHPHVYPNQTVCMGSWTTTEYLEEFVLRMGALLQYDRRYLNIRDPANADAMAWAARNLILLPTDHRTFQGDDELSSAPEPPQDDLLFWRDIDEQ